MAMEIFKLVGSVMVDGSAANQSLSSIGEKAHGVASALGTGVAVAAKFGASIAGTVFEAGKKVVAEYKEFASELDTIDKASQRMGVSAEYYQELSHQADLCGVSMSTMEKAAKNLEKNTDYDFDQAMNEIWSLQTAEERAARAAELFGESAAYDMAPMLNASAEDMESMREEARALGLVLSNDTVAAGATMSDSFAKISATFDSIKNTVLAAFLPAIQTVLDYIVTYLPVVVNTVQSMLGGVTTFLTGVFTGDWEMAWEGIKEVFSGAWEGIKVIFQKPLNWMIERLNSFIDGINNIQIPDWVPGVGGKGLNIAHIPMLAKGGVLERGQTGFLEGNGAEAVVPLAQNKEWTQSVAADMSGALGGAETVGLLKDILAALEAVSGDLYLDGDKLVGGISSKMDRALGGLTINRRRGLA